MLRTLFCSSAALALNVHGRLIARAADLLAEPDDLHWLMIGDYGSRKPAQSRVAAGLRDYVGRLQLHPEGLLLLGDNFYGPMPGGLQSPRWREGFEDIYPPALFPGPCPAVLGNHDYHDQPGGEQDQLAYARQPGTRWTLPHKWYRRDYPEKAPLVTFLFLDTNLRPVSGGKSKKTGLPQPCLTAAEEAAQWAWLDAEFARPRAPWTICVGHHPIYNNGRHGDQPALIAELAPRLERHAVPLYLCGHDHDLQHLELEGLATSFVISGGGGADLYEVVPSARGRFVQSVFGFSHLQINPRRLLLRHLDESGRQLHAFTKPLGARAVAPLL